MKAAEKYIGFKYYQITLVIFYVLSVFALFALKQIFL
jgi:hypothetical protein